MEKGCKREPSDSIKYVDNRAFSLKLLILKSYDFQNHDI